MYARYTEYLRDIMLNEHTKPLLDKALSTYPLYEKKSKEEFIPSVVPTREELNQKLLNHYKYREIGFETVGRFIDELEIAMCEIMPHYNQLLLTLDQDYNMQYNVDYKKTFDTTRNSEGESNSTNNSSSEGSATSSNSTESNSSLSNTSRDLKADTPQSTNDFQVGIDDVDYASEAGWNKGEGTSSNSSNDESNSSSSSSGTSTSTGNDKRTDTEIAVETTKGNFGVVSAQDLIKKYRELIINVEQMIIQDARIQELFMQVY